VDRLGMIHQVDLSIGSTLKYWQHWLPLIWGKSVQFRYGQLSRQLPETQAEQQLYPLTPKRALPIEVI
jgi:hypothetical protein